MAWLVMRMTLLKGEPVTIYTPTITYDENKDEVVTWTETELDNVLFGKPSTEQVDETMRLYGVHAQYSLGIPKEYTDSLRGCKVYRPRDERMYVIAGDPMPLPPEICPTPWNREAIAGWVDG